MRSGVAPVTSGSRMSQPCTVTPSVMVNSRDSRTYRSTSARVSPWLVTTVSSPEARSTRTISPNEVGVARAIAADPPAIERPLTTWPSPPCTRRGSPPVDGTAYRWVQPRSRMANNTSPSAVNCGSAPGYAGAPGMTLRSRVAASSVVAPVPRSTAKRPACPEGSPCQPTTTRPDASGVKATVPAKPSPNATSSGRAFGSVRSSTCTPARISRSSRPAGLTVKAIASPSGRQPAPKTCSGSSLSWRVSPEARSSTWSCIRMPRMKPLPSAW